MATDKTFDLKNPPEYILKLLVATAADDYAERLAAQSKFAQALELPLRKGVLYADNVRDIYEPVKFAPGQTIEWPLDLLAPGEEDEFVAYTSAGLGRIPDKQVQGDYVTGQTYWIESAMQWEIQFAKNALWDVVSRALQVLEAGFTRKINNDGWRVILTACADRNVMVYDADATAGQFTKRLVSLLKTYMARNGGGNVGSVRRGRCTDLFLAIEGIEDVRNWGVDQVDEITRREIYVAADGSLNRIFSVNLHGMTEFGEGQKYQQYFTEQLGGSLAASDLELLIGLDLETVESLVMPVREQVTIFDDPTLHRQQRQGYYGWGEWGFACLDNRCVIAGSC